MNLRVLTLIFFLVSISCLITSFSIKEFVIGDYTIEKLRALYSSGDSKNWPIPTLDSSIIDEYVEIGNLETINHPKNNPYSIEKAELGKKLFFDPRLSGSGQVSCASCHEPQLAWGDGKRVSHGDLQKQGSRNAPTIINIGQAQSLFWDGRAGSLEEQAHAPVESTIEMNTKFAVAVQNIQNIKGYDSLFAGVYGDQKVTENRIKKALATYQRTIKSTNTRFDHFIRGNEEVFTDQEVLGLHLFRTKGRCVNCHYSPYFSDQKFHNVGLTYYQRYYEDLGVYNQTGKKEDVGRFKTPTLREVAKTGPYMHNGLFPDLGGIMNMYNVGMPRPRRKPKQENDTLFPTTSVLLKPLKLSTEEKDAIEAFLKTLTSRTANIEVFVELPN
ncbi:cytochrome-c peroxidase [Aquimarina pacifica]|uniref:cytochrome-c peroxidase n=1 Tax=Aquimarina pacifica TaxID=1296415 RepID=UPI00046EAE90|nr:cytochrome c peroxidase [Aquimarina pacifica]